MRILALFGVASFLVVGTLIGVRMLLLARRTRSLPELLLGAGLTSLTFVTLPAVGLSLGARVGSVGFQAALFGFGLVPVVGFAMCLVAFTATIFRPGRAWARASVLAAGAVAAAGVAGTVYTRTSAWEVNQVVGAHWAAMLIAPFVIAMTWTGIESLAYHLKLRRRLALGLVDPVVCNRLLLWALGNLGAVAGTAIVAASLFAGWRVVNHPVPMLAISAAGLALSGSWYLAFLAPESYLERVRAKAAAA